MANIDPLLERNQHFATDVDTGLITTVIPAAPMHASTSGRSGVRVSAPLTPARECS